MTHTCEKCTMQATKMKTDEAGVVHYFCDHHAPEGATKMGAVVQVKKNLLSYVKTYWPLFVILLVILAYIDFRSSVVRQYSLRSFSNDFMAAFFIIFGILQLTAHKSFQETFRRYDPIGYRYPDYAYLYPYILIFFGLLLHFHVLRGLVAILIILLLGAQTYGIVKVLRRKEELQCACVGTKIKLPLSWVTVGENALMIVMAIAMIVLGF